MSRLWDLIEEKKPLCLGPTASVKRACQEMRKQRASAVLITDGGRLTGIFTSRDAVKVIAEGKDRTRVTVRDAMTRNPVTITPYATPIEALRLMWDGGFRHLPVTDKGTLVGLILRRNFKSEDFAQLDDERELWEHMR
ncbi:MAG TPA: CBS domain-containing protein [Micropepsaceae bacterium]|nr:CBS domain-containing protein [Micropepsaceae bacterium]